VQQVQLRFLSRNSNSVLVIPPFHDVRTLSNRRCVPCLYRLYLFCSLGFCRVVCCFHLNSPRCFLRARWPVLVCFVAFMCAQFPEMTTRAMAMLNDYVLVGGNTMVTTTPGPLSSPAVLFSGSFLLSSSDHQSLCNMCPPIVRLREIIIGRSTHAVYVWIEWPAIASRGNILCPVKKVLYDLPPPPPDRHRWTHKFCVL
jgi:hypothetical protein